MPRFQTVNYVLNPSSQLYRCQLQAFSHKKDLQQKNKQTPDDPPDKHSEQYAAVNQCLSLSTWQSFKTHTHTNTPRSISPNSDSQCHTVIFLMQQNLLNFITTSVTSKLATIALDLVTPNNDKIKIVKESLCVCACSNLTKILQHFKA